MKRVLILDNDSDVLDVMEAALTYEGYEVSCTEATVDIFLLIDYYKPDLLIVDYLLNGVNGGELCRQVKTNPKTCLVPVIIISAYPFERLTLDRYGADDFMPKPFDLNDLIACVKKLTDKTMDEESHVI